MQWKDLPYWLKGGVTSSIIYLLIIILRFVPYIGVFFDYLFYFTAFIPAIFLSLDPLENLIGVGGTYIVIGLLMYFLVGSIIGLIYRKIKLSENKSKTMIIIIIILTITITGYFSTKVILSSQNIEFCDDNNYVCKYKQFYKNPEICETGKWYVWHCSIEPAIYFKDSSFCDKGITKKNVVMFYYESMRTEEDLQRMGVKFDYESEVNKQRDRCKQWVNYYQNKEFSTESSDRRRPWESGYPPSG